MKALNSKTFLKVNGKKFSIKLIEQSSNSYRVDEFDILKNGKEKQTTGRLFSDIKEATEYFNSMVELYINLGKTEVL